ncbi:MAG TPA: acyltransferase family protein [Propionicimonas sp.]|uniref:acyltransferase family protein n=1 Tax=Propionicimonas sp. TaxID=1955623 RepID=UPI002F405F8A
MTSTGGAAPASATGAGSGSGLAGRRRVFYLDNLRAVAVLAVLLLHASICYMVAAPQWWYVVDPDVSTAFTVIVLIVDVPVMSAMFLVAGYFAVPSWRRRGTGGLVTEKLIRLGAPWVFGVLVLAPALTYLSYVSRGIPMPYLQFWATDFWGPRYQQSVYWFLGVLLALFLLLGVVLRLRPSLAERPAAPTAEPWRAVLAVFVVGAVAATALSPFFGLDDWKPVAWVFLVQPARVALYPSFFVLGIHAERQGWLAGDGWRPSVRAWIPASLATGIAYLAFRVAGYSATVPARIVGGVLFAAFCVSAVLAALAGFSRWADRSTRGWRTLADNAFGIYYVHPLVLYPGALLLVGLAVPGALKAVVVLAVTVGLSLAISAGVLRRAPILRRVF